MMRSALLPIVALAGLLGCAELPPQPSSPPSSASGSAADQCGVGRVIDGDTVEIACLDGSSINARLLGYDTPETFRPSCQSEAALGARATARLMELIDTARLVQFADYQGQDRYDRALLRLLVDGQDVGDILIAEGLARPYFGGRRQSWCA